MAAPDGIVWGSEVGDYGRIGIYKKVSSTNTSTKTTVSVQVWFWSKWTVTDTSNDFYYNNLASSGSASTKVKSNTSIKTTSNSSWSKENQIKIYTVEQCVRFQKIRIIWKLNRTKL